MKAFLKHFRQTVTSGLILLIPVFVLIVVLQKLWDKMTGFGKQLSDMLGINSIAGIGAAKIATTVILIAVFYGCGLLVRFAYVNRVKAWVEDNLLQYIPGYIGYKVKMTEKLENKLEQRTAVMAKIFNGWRPGFLVSRDNGKSVVSIPFYPEADLGEIWVLDDQDVEVTGPADKAFLVSLQQGGKGLRV